MVKVMYCIARKPELSEMEFSRYWREVHGPIGARIPGLRALVQNHALRIEGDPRSPDFDGVAELWFDDLDALAAARRSPEWKASSGDENHFIDPDRVAYLVAVEHTIVPQENDAE